MRSVLFLTLVFLTFSCLHGSINFVKISTYHNVKSMRLNLSSRIVNGTKAAPRQFPHQVSLMNTRTGIHYCGGSIISIKLVLTAAHCMFHINGTLISLREIIVVGGVLKLNESTVTRQERGVEEFRTHPEYKSNYLQNDIAVLQLSAPFEFTPEVHSVPLPTNPIVSRTLCQVSGWGLLTTDVPVASNDLMYVDLPIRSTTECHELLNSTYLSGMFCAGYLEGGKDACQRDSGSGMICNGILTGIVSFGIGCGRPKFPGVYTDIFYYLNWISENENIIILQGFNNSRSNNGTHKMPTIIILMISFFFVLLSVIS
ncbi:trypsin-3-like [Anoplolepis gracilipes]|uniref:trypsin-3-like n=1 Tax=Anoplolepis gracilipes TaxID=354296 RepID=UPI003BA0E028